VATLVATPLPILGRITAVNPSILVVPVASVPGRGAHDGLVPKEGRPEPKEGHGSP
jgi:hypothetical protein